MAVKAKFEGVQKLRIRMADLARLADKDSRTAASRKLNANMREISTDLRDAIRAAARASGWPSRTIKTIFAFGDVSRDQLPKSIRADLVGVRRGAPPRRDPDIYREWNAGDSKSPNAKRGIGERVGMSLAAMWEFGTTKIQATAAFRRTYAAMRSIIRARMIGMYKEVIEEFNK